MKENSNDNSIQNKKLLLNKSDQYINNGTGGDFRDELSTDNSVVGTNVGKNINYFKPGFSDLLNTTNTENGAKIIGETKAEISDFNFKTDLE